MPLYPVPTPVSKGVIVTGTVHNNTVITATAEMREQEMCIRDSVAISL